MTAYRFRFKFDPDPTSQWRDIVTGSDRTLDELQATLNASVGLDCGHLWFIAVDEDYWDSAVKYQCPSEFDDSQGGPALGFGEETHDAGETTVGDVVEQQDLEERDRICYLYDYGDEWRFYAILKNIIADGASERGPEVVDKNGDGVRQYRHDG